MAQPQISDFTKVAMHYAEIVKLENSALVPERYFGATREILRDELLHPCGGRAVSDEFGHCIGQYIYLDNH